MSSFFRKLMIYGPFVTFHISEEPWFVEVVPSRMYLYRFYEAQIRRTPKIVTQIYFMILAKFYFITFL
jgi:hypothetical protein